MLLEDVYTITKLDFEKFKDLFFEALSIEKQTSTLKVPRFYLKDKTQKEIIKDAHTQNTLVRLMINSDVLEIVLKDSEALKYFKKASTKDITTLYSKIFLDPRVKEADIEIENSFSQYIVESNGKKVLGPFKNETKQHVILFQHSDSEFCGYYDIAKQKLGSTNVEKKHVITMAKRIKGYSENVVLNLLVGKVEDLGKEFPPYEIGEWPNFKGLLINSYPFGFFENRYFEDENRDQYAVSKFFTYLIKRFFPNDLDHALFLRWLKKTLEGGNKTACVFLGPQGVGKSTLINILKTLIGKYVTIKAVKSHFTSKFTPDFNSNRLCYVDDVNLNESTGDDESPASKIKQFINGDVTIEKKGVDASTGQSQNCSFLFANNFPEQLPYSKEEFTNRRFLTFSFTDVPLNTTLEDLKKTYFEEIEKNKLRDIKFNKKRRHGNTVKEEDKVFPHLFSDEENLSFFLSTGRLIEEMNFLEDGTNFSDEEYYELYKYVRSIPDLENYGTGEFVSQAMVGSMYYSWKKHSATFATFVKKLGGVLKQVESGTFKDIGQFCWVYENGVMEFCTTSLIEYLIKPHGKNRELCLPSTAIGFLKRLKLFTTEHLFYFNENEMGEKINTVADYEGEEYPWTDLVTTIDSSYYCYTTSEHIRLLNSSIGYPLEKKFSEIEEFSNVRFDWSGNSYHYSKNKEEENFTKVTYKYGYLTDKLLPNLKPILEIRNRGVTGKIKPNFEEDLWEE